MKYVKAAIVLGCMFNPQAFLAKAGGAGGAGGAGAAGDVIQEEGQQVTSISAKRRTNRSLKSPKRELCAGRRHRNDDLPIGCGSSKSGKSKIEKSPKSSKSSKDRSGGYS